MNNTKELLVDMPSWMEARIANVANAINDSAENLAAELIAKFFIAQVVHT